jgi:hypothetical protein
MNCIGPKSFVFEGTTYNLSKKDLFYEKQENDCQLWCYFLEKEMFSIGMVSLKKIDQQMILEKIWLKSRERITKEKLFFEKLELCSVCDAFENTK